MRITPFFTVALMAAVGCSNATFAQKKIQQTTEQAPAVDYTKDPAWIKMIDNPATNYYEAIKAYDMYWNGKLTPMEEEDVLGEKENKKEEREREAFEKKLAAMTPAEKNNYDQMVYECKRFENWKRDVFPFVQEDGRILTVEERNQIYLRQQEEIKNK